MKRALFVLWLIAAVSRVSAQSVTCPLQLKSVDLLPAHSWHAFPLRYDFSRNLEMVLRVRYKNISGKEIISSHLSTTISLYEPGPVHAKTTYGERDVALMSRVLAGEEKTMKEKILTSGVPPHAWVREITYSDGSRWTSSDPAQCQYSPHHVRSTTGPVIPPL